MAHFKIANNQETKNSRDSCSLCYFMELQHLTWVIAWHLKYLTHPPSFFFYLMNIFSSISIDFFSAFLALGHLFPFYTQSLSKNFEYNTHIGIPPKRYLPYLRPLS